MVAKILPRNEGTLDRAPTVIVGLGLLALVVSAWPRTHRQELPRGQVPTDLGGSASTASYGRRGPPSSRRSSGLRRVQALRRSDGCGVPGLRETFAESVPPDPAMRERLQARLREEVGAS